MRGAVFFGEEFQTQNLNFYFINVIIKQSQKYYFFPPVTE